MVRKLILFDNISLDGFYEGKNHDLSWNNVDPEYDKFAIKQLKSTDLILFGRKTYELMAKFWPTPEAIKREPIIADFLNNTPKIVVSKTLDKADYNNSRIIKENIIEEIKKLKEMPGKNIIILGSSDLAVSIIDLIDQFEIMVNPILVGEGKSIFYGIDKRINLELVKTQQFKSGNVLLSYKHKK